MKKCVVCESKQCEALFIIDEVKIVRCRDCGLVRTLGKAKISYKEYHRDDDYAKHEQLFRNIFHKRFDRVKRYKKGGRVLDIGASTGTMLQIFKFHGWDVWGVEPSNSAEGLSEKGIKCTNSTFEKAKLPTNYFDVVIINHVLEHVENPVSFLEKVNEVLKKDGIVYVDVPNFDSLISMIRGKNWKYLSPGEHLYHFTPKTLENTLKRAGFEIIWCGTSSGVFDVARPLLKLAYEARYLRRNFLFDIFRVPLDIASQISNRGASLAVIAKKS
ncbi:MAG: Methylase involved in ubiquinone/menaquinone biosynthesis [Candidatus Woesebacteria bacterium GW2011_GWB1_43_14]|uniref:Methylase involved in ubiquinone/menaquinone biosynthesis n=1 Tax=Candidatus Woesebacteria bacterium GW2011_GWB1_43_14 TaxID=1618578 RepID=A0A0G1DHM9_9BACT|nr:MAG: Methylase involved in ubiquinone/menaquinone biosynthesis [Candidatus Woesebacteria bacterium GW2011_GWA1_39_11b]KKS78394.1 MAG: Methylase involved in ubiquinone/menaquinone biosynthesis [Candidatus Woesebacteria bacterium GW2011_GWC1_42_9]KKS97189.1 MAG: Methylase involved in ubiquinone/menaquinone biosynthesis [Candidatus Woesebacteria bacterium GW2011_GWB1_43_14]